jgi:hypothetical protein
MVGEEAAAAAAKNCGEPFSDACRDTPPYSSSSHAQTLEHTHTHTLTHSHIVYWLNKHTSAGRSHLQRRLGLRVSVVGFRV